MKNQTLAEALIKFTAWSDELAKIEAETDTAAADELMRILYGDRTKTEKLIGGQNAPIFIDAARQINRLQAMAKEVSGLKKQLANATFLYERNCGSHHYPGICGPTSDEMFTSDCAYCACVMGPSNSSSPEGVDQFGDCPGNPKLRDAYELLKGAHAST